MIVWKHFYDLKTNKFCCLFVGSQEIQPKLGAVQLLRNAFLTNFDPPPPVTKCHTDPNPPSPRNVTLICRPGRKSKIC